MGNKTWKVLGVIGLYAVLAWNSPVTAKAAEIEVETSTTLYAKIDAPDVVVRKAKNAGGEAVTKVLRGQTYEVAAPAEGGWVKISTAEGEGYIPSNRATLIEKTKEKVDESVKLRQDVVLSLIHIYISDMTNKSRDKYAYTLLDLESTPDAMMIQKLNAIKGVLRVRVIK